MFPNGNKDENAGFLCIFLSNQLDQKVTRVSATEFAIVNVNKEEVKTWPLESGKIFEAFNTTNKVFKKGKVVLKRLARPP